MPEPTEFQRGVDAAMHDLLEYGREFVIGAAEASAETATGLNSKFSSGYRRFAFHHMNKVA